MHCVGNTGEGPDASVVIQAELPWLILSTRLDVDMPGYDQAGAAARQIGIEADQIVGGIALAGRHGFGRRRADDPVLENETSIFPGDMNESGSGDILFERSAQFLLSQAYEPVAPIARVWQLSARKISQT